MDFKYNDHIIVTVLFVFTDLSQIQEASQNSWCQINNVKHFINNDRKLLGVTVKCFAGDRDLYIPL
jgi:hypothetical protein